MKSNLCLSKTQIMKAIATALILSSSILIFFTVPANSANSCPPVSCHNTSGPIIRFPFRLSTRQPARCGYPGFDLYCNSHNLTILNLPESGEFIVKYIDYRRQTLLIDDPDSCLPNRFLNFTLTGSPFLGINPIDYTFLNCSYNRMDYSLAQLTLQCRSGRNYTVMPKDSDHPVALVPDTCQRIADVSVPMQSTFSMTLNWTVMDLLAELELGWMEPLCGRCENVDGTCGYLGDSGLEIGCLLPSGGGVTGISRGLMVGTGIPILVFLLGLVSYSIIRVIKTSILQGRLPVTGISAQRLATESSSGLDGPTIESYPKTVLGASGRLPDPSDVTCSICLSDYQPEQTLRTIPACNHYFHSDCIDGWLKLKGTCPLCRNLPRITPPSSMSISSSTFATSDDH